MENNFYTYWFLYREYFEGRGFFFDWRQENLKYTINPEEAARWYNRTKEASKKVEMVRYWDRKVSVLLPLDTTEYHSASWMPDWVDVDTNFDLFIASGALPPKTEQVLQRFMKDYVLGTNGFFYKQKRESTMSNSNLFALQCMKDVILWIIRLSPLQIPVGKDDENKLATKYMEWDLGEDIEVEYEVQWEKKRTTCFGIYSPKVIQAMYPESDFNGHPLQRWQRESKLYGWEITYIVWPRWWGKSMSESADGAVYLLKEVTSRDEKVQEFSIQYHGLSQMGNQPYINYIRNGYRNLIDLDNFCRFDTKLQQISILDWNKKRTIDFMTTGQTDPARGRRSRNIKVDEADYMDWKTVQTVVGANPNATITMISTISVDSKAWEFYKRWKDAFIKMKEYEPIDALIDDIRHKYGFDRARSRKDYFDMIEKWVFDRARREFFDRRPVVALHYTIDDLESMSQQEKNAMISKSIEAWWEDYMLAELYWEYSGTDILFPMEWKIATQMPHTYDQVILWYDEADDFDYPGLCAIGIVWDDIYVDATWRLPSDIESRVKQLKDTVAYYKSRATSQRVPFVIDITRWPAMGRELAMYWIPQDMQIKWTAWTWYNPWVIHKVSKDWIIKTARTDFFARSNFFINPDCQWPDWLVEEIENYKKSGKKFLWQKKKKDDQVSAMLLAMYYIRYTFSRLFVSQALTQAVNYWVSQAELERAKKYWTCKDERAQALYELKRGFF